MSMCGICRSKVERSSLKIDCNLCTKIFHGACVNLKNSDIDNLKNSNSVWQCDKCRQSKRSSLSSATNNSSSVTLEVIYNELLSIKQHTENTSGRLAQLENLLHNMAAENIELKKRIADLEEKIEKHDHMMHNNQLDFVNVPNNNDDENTIKKIVEEGLGINVLSDDIEYCYRKKIKRRDNSLNIVSVKFLRHSMVKKILAANKLKNKKRESINCSIIENNNKNRIFINQWLSSTKRQILSAAKKVKKEKKLQVLMDGKWRYFHEEN